MNEREGEQALGSTAPDTLGKCRRGDRMAELFEKLDRDAVRKTAPSAPDGEVAAFSLKIDMAMFHGELDAQRAIRPLEADEPLHQPESADRGDRRQSDNSAAARVHPAIRAIGDNRQGFGGAQIQALTFRREGNAACLAVEQPVAEPAFELGDLAAYCAMGEVQGIGCGGKTAGAGGRIKGSQRVEGR